MVNEEGFDWIWLTGQVPYLLKNKVKTYCYTKNEVPFLCRMNVQEEGTMLPQELEVQDTLGIPGGEAIQPTVTPPVKPKRVRKKKEPLVVIKNPQAPDIVVEVPSLDAALEAIVKDRVKKRIQKKNQKKKVIMSKTSSKHNIFTHFPKDPNCEICRRNKPQRASCSSKATRPCDALPTPVIFGDATTLDHKILNDDDVARE